MAEITKTQWTAPTITPYPQAQPGVPSIASQLVPANNKHTGLRAAVQIYAGDACYIGSDGLVHQSTGAAANAAAVVDGFAAINAAAGEAVTLVFGVTFGYPNTEAPGTPLYLSGVNAGGLADATSTGGTAIIAKVIDARRIYVQKSY